MNVVRNFLVMVLLVCFTPCLQADEAGKTKAPYAHTNSKGKTYFLFSKDVQRKNSDKVQTIYYFAKDPKNPKGKPLAKVPEDRIVSETKTGMLVLKKKVKSEEPKKKATEKKAGS